MEIDQSTFKKAEIMLTLRHVEVSMFGFRRIAIFGSEARACAHLSDHVLTRPEAQFWAELIPDYTSWVDVEDDDSLYRFAKSLWRGQVPAEAVQALYDGYARVIAEALRDALALGWYWCEQEEHGAYWRGLGLSGTYVIWRAEAVRTAMLIGYAAPRDGRELPLERRRGNPLPRQHTWVYRGARLRHEHTHYPPPRSLRSNTARYDLFKRCAVRARREFKAACLTGQVIVGGGDLGSLHEHVPDLATWQHLRTTVQQSHHCLADA